MYSGRLVIYKIDLRRKEAEGFHKYKKNAKTLGDVQSTPPHYQLKELLMVLILLILILRPTL